MMDLRKYRLANAKRPTDAWIDESGFSSRIRNERDVLDEAYEAQVRAICERLPPDQRKGELKALREKYEQDIKKLHGLEQ